MHACGVCCRGATNVGQMGFAGAELQHKSLVEPVFLAYNRVSAETQYTLMQIATAISDSLSDDCAVDAVQPIHIGWWIYLRTQAD